MVLQDSRPADASGLQTLPRWLLAPLPLWPLRPVLQRAVRQVVRRRPELFDRLGEHETKTFLIDPSNLPFVVLLRPDPAAPCLWPSRRHSPGPYDARIAGTFLTLLALLDGRVDGDALFFSRELRVSGDIDAVVSLRNALDDLDASVADDVAAAFGAPGQLVLAGMRRIERGNGRRDAHAP